MLDRKTEIRSSQKLEVGIVNSENLLLSLRRSKVITTEKDEDMTTCLDRVITYIEEELR